MGLASRVTAGDQRNVSLATDVPGMPHTLSHLSAQVIAPRDGRDDRVRHLLQPLRQPASGHQMAHDVPARSMAVDPVPQDVIRWAAPTGAGDHAVTAGGLFPCGQSTDDPTRPRSKGRRGALAPVGMPRARDVWSGERADAGRELPLRARLRPGVPTTGRVCVGECQLRAWATRA